MMEKIEEVWTEKYRPKRLDEIIGQEDIARKIRALIDTRSIPHCLFAGHAGVGKSTMVFAVANELFGEKWKNNFLDLNASDERGIDTIRVRVKDFARTIPMSGGFKVIFLDEADALTKDAQHALRRIMENYSDRCRFFLSCVTPDTKILLPEEVEISIDDFTKKFENKKLKKILNFNKNNPKEDLVLASIKIDPKIIGKKILEITTMTGRKLRVTDDHKLLTSKGWKPSGQLTKDDRLLIYPNLESVYFEDNETKIIDINDFIEFLTRREEKEGYKDIINANEYKNLKTIEKNKIIDRIKELKNFIRTNKGLTKREKEVYDTVKNNENISRLDIQRRIGLTRIRTNHLLKSLESKGYIVRYVAKGKIHNFIISNKKPLVLRNLMDIKNIIAKEFGITISYTSIKKALSSEIMHGNLDRVIGELKRKNLLDLTYNSEKKGVLSRIAAFMLGDGHIAKNDIRLYFSGNKKALENVKKDLRILGYENFSEISEKYISNEIRGREFTGVSTSFYLDSRSLSIFLQYIGVPKGDKAASSYTVPSFIKNGTKFVKREFLRSFFGCEADKPSCKKRNFYAVNLRQSKIKSLKNNMIEYLNEIKKLLKDFEIDSYITIRDLGETRRKDSQGTLAFLLTINPSNINLQKFFSRIGYAYEEYKSRLSRLSAEYLKHKLFIIESWRKKSELIQIEIGNGESYRKAAESVGCSSDFVAAQLKGKKVGLPWKKILEFNEWINKYENNCFVENEILEIKEIESDDVRDITCFEDHNFVSNGFISHNCNYLSRIIHPIQSRTAVFRFSPLKEDDVVRFLKKVCESEGLGADESSLKAIFDVSEGDMRKAINILQMASLDKEISEKTIYDIVKKDAEKTRRMLGHALSGDFLAARDVLIALLENMPGEDIIKEVHDQIFGLEISDKEKIALLEKTGECEFRIVEGSNSRIQIGSLLAYIALNSKKQ